MVWLDEVFDVLPPLNSQPPFEKVVPIVADGPVSQEVLVRVENIISDYVPIEDQKIVRDHGSGIRVTADRPQDYMRRHPEIYGINILEDAVGIGGFKNVYALVWDTYSTPKVVLHEFAHSLDSALGRPSTGASVLPAPDTYAVTPLEKWAQWQANIWLGFPVPPEVLVFFQ